MFRFCESGSTVNDWLGRGSAVRWEKAIEVSKERVTIEIAWHFFVIRRQRVGEE